MLCRRVVGAAVRRRLLPQTRQHSTLEAALADGDGVFPAERLRTFAILAHVDHGKSTLADRILEFTSPDDDAGKHETVLDTLDVERERGITVKSQTASFLFTPPGEDEPYLLNLIDTPGHVDFSYEVSRALAACSGALLLVDSSQGVQAQTLANYRKAKEAGIEHFVPVLTKLDLPLSDPDSAADQLCTLFGFDEDDILLTSAKTGEGVDEVLGAIVSHLPPPSARSSSTASSTRTWAPSRWSRSRPARCARATRSPRCTPRRTRR